MTIQPISKAYYNQIPQVYASSFNQVPWPANWYKTPQYTDQSSWIALIDSQVVGFVISFISNGKPYISVLATHRDYQRRGIGTHLIQTVFDYWERKGCRSIYIHVDMNKKPALALYSKMGFKKTSEKYGSYELEYYYEADKDPFCSNT